MRPANCATLFPTAHALRLYDGDGHANGEVWLDRLQHRPLQKKLSVHTALPPNDVRSSGIRMALGELGAPTVTGVAKQKRKLAVYGISQQRVPPASQKKRRRKRQACPTCRSPCARAPATALQMSAAVLESRQQLARQPCVALASVNAYKLKLLRMQVSVGGGGG